MRETSHEVSPRGEGNVVSIEFNLLYRWHATSSEQDRKLTEELFAKVLPGFDMKTVRYPLESLCRPVSYSLADLRSRFLDERGTVLASWSGCQAVGVWRVCNVIQNHEKGYTYARLHSIKRDGSGRFNDADIARILQNATEAPASAFKARGTPEVLRVIELLGIEQGRAWGTCTVRMLKTRFTGSLFCCFS
jgi:linoleate 10R-lipoxygenase